MHACSYTYNPGKYRHIPHNKDAIGAAAVGGAVVYCVGCLLWVIVMELRYRRDMDRKLHGPHRKLTIVD